MLSSSKRNIIEVEESDELDESFSSLLVTKSITFMVQNTGLGRMEPSKAQSHGLPSFLIFENEREGTSTRSGGLSNSHNGWFEILLLVPLS